MSTEFHRIADFNVNGGYTTAHGSWTHRRPLVIDTMLDSDADVFLLQEAHEEKNEHRWIRDAMNARSPITWRLVSGDGGNHFIMNDALFSVIRKTTIHLPHSRDFTEVNLQHKPTGVKSWTWNTHLIAPDLSKGRTKEMAAAMREDQAAVIANRVSRLHRCVGGGDANDGSTGGLRGALAAVGHDDVRTRVDTVENGEYNSWDGNGPNPMRGRWIDILAAADLATVVATGLIDSGDASDHNLIWADVSFTS